MREIELTTPVNPDKPSFNLSYQDNFFLMGSCFANNISSKLNYNKFNVLSNPFGTIYNPLSIEILFSNIFNKNIEEAHFTEKHKNSVHYDFHSYVNAESVEVLRQSIYDTYYKAEKFLKNNGQLTIILSLGTSWVYRLNKTGKVVSNCHKTPQKAFTKELTEPTSIINALENIINQLLAINKETKFIFTLSPVRHIKDSPEGNSISKSILRYAIHKVTQQNKNTSYFPSFEIMMDELRDYRFYGNDMLHPSEIAIDIIWYRFLHTYFDAESIKLVKKWQEIKKAVEHIPFNPESEEHQKFIKKTLEKLETFSSWFNVDEEKIKLEKQLL